MKTNHRVHDRHDHQHGPDCGHKIVEHEGHKDYLHDGHLHSVDMRQFRTATMSTMSSTDICITRTTSTVTTTGQYGSPEASVRVENSLARLRLDVPDVTTTVPTRTG